ncbi:MAG: DUF2259 domain-containing protein [Pseudomonadota bacterium]
MKAVFLAISILFFSVSGWSGQAMDFESFGFSKDGRYFAFIQDAVLDGSGAYWIEMGIIDVENNKYVGRASTGGEMEVNGDWIIADPAQRPEFIEDLKQKLSFQKYDFPKKVNEEVIVSRPNTDLTIYKNTVFSLEYWPEGGASASLQRYELDLKEVAAPVTEDNDWCDWYGNNMIELKVNHKHFFGDYKDKVQVLQKDQRQPKVRACSSDYSIRYVLNHKDGIAVVLSYQSPGFEGPNKDFMVVTGKL